MRAAKLVVFSLALSAACTTTQASSPPPAPPPAAPALDDDAPPRGQLPEAVRPLRYRLHLAIAPGEQRFLGEVEIDVELQEASDRVWLHGQGLEVTSAAVVVGAERLPAVFRQETESGVASLTVERPIAKGAATLVIAYTAPFDTQLKGLYRVVEGGHSYAFTQFESHFARLAFPCFDEPRFKAPFALAVTAPAGDLVVTATREQSKEPSASGVRWTFAETPPLPSYLIAFAVGPLDVVEPAGGALPPNEVRKAPLPFRAFAAKGKGEELRYAVEHTAPLLAALERWFGEPYPFAKLDVIAVPDFSSGAMENVGAITFREALLLVDEEAAPVAQKQWFAAVMTHELAHMWFGNLVTMPWWDDIWLNEAFATWMASKIVDEVHPEYQLGLSFQERARDAMGYDSLLSARQIRQPIASDHDIRNAFDAITYQKGGAVLAMFESYLGEEVFRRGIQRYLDEHRFGSATYEDLLAALGAASGRDVATPFSTFLFQPGVPYLSLDVSCEGAPRVVVEQARFLPLGSRGERARSWQVPLCLRLFEGKTEKQQCALLEGPRSEVALDAKTCPSVVVPNAGAAGYYRYALPLPWLDPMAKARLPARERLDYADALRAAFSSGALSASEVLARLAPLAADEERAVASAPLPLLEGLLRDVVPAPSMGDAKAWARALYRPQLTKLGYRARPGESPSTQRLRAEVLSFMALVLDDRAVQGELARIGRAALEDPARADPEVLPVALRAAVRAGDVTLFDKMLARFYATDDALMRGYLLDALGSTTDPALAPRARALTLDAKVRGNEALRALSLQAAQRETRDDAWAYLVEAWPRLLEVIPTTRQGSLPWLAASLCDDGRAQEVRAFFADKIEAIICGPRNLDGALEAIALCAAKRDHHRESAAGFFAQGGKVTER